MKQEQEIKDTLDMLESVYGAIETTNEPLESVISALKYVLEVK
jgi:hypothetical protein